VNWLIKPIDDRGPALVRSVDVVRISRAVLVLMTNLPLIVAFGCGTGRRCGVTPMVPWSNGSPTSRPRPDGYGAVGMRA
jgi:hypothetical protein